MSENNSSENKICGSKKAELFEVAIYGRLGDRLDAFKDERNFLDAAFTNKSMVILATLLATAGVAEVDRLISPEMVFKLMIVGSVAGVP